jgi:hypothetical protein
MIGLYLAIIMVWMWAVLVFAPERHMRGIVLLPVYLPVAAALRWLSIGLDLCRQATDWVYTLWVDAWLDSFEKFDHWVDCNKKGGA